MNVKGILHTRYKNWGTKHMLEVPREMLALRNMAESSKMVPTSVVSGKEHSQPLDVLIYRPVSFRLKL